MLQKFLPLTLVLALALGPVTGSAQEPAPALPEGCAPLLHGQRVTLAVPNSAGGGYDIYARSLAPELERIGGLSVRVVNLPGGGGKAALQRVANAPADDPAMLIESATDVAAVILNEPAMGYQPTDIEAIGVVTVEPEAWLGRPDLSLVPPPQTPLIAAVSSLEANLVSIGLTARVLGLEVNYITGYGGSSDQTASLMRGETDLNSKSLGTALQAAQDGSVKILLSLSDGPPPSQPDVPWLVGPDGLVAQFSAGLPEAERAERQRLARQVSAIAETKRMLFVSARMEPRLQACLSALSDAALHAPGFRQTAEAQRRMVAPAGRAEAAALYLGTHQALVELAPLLDAMRAQARN